jgi:hypothetical protein
MDWGLFLAGFLGALTFILLVRQVAIPEFRPLYDTAAREAELTLRKESIASEQSTIEAYEKRVISGVDPAAPLLQALITRHDDRTRDHETRLERLERDLTANQALSRGLGFVAYMVLGGFFGQLLAGRITIEGVQQDIGLPLQAFVIGSAWSAYLSTVGLRFGERVADTRLERLDRYVTTELDKVRNTLPAGVETEVAKVEQAAPGSQPTKPQEIALAVEDALRETTDKVHARLEAERVAVARAFR